MNDKINEIAGLHLGKAGDGTAVKPYVTPDSVDSSLLVAVPRHLNRTQYGIDDNNLKFWGVDVWNCYEVSFLLECGAPVSGVLKLSYSSSSPSIVESKSLKLYLNSFNMERFKTNNVQEAIKLVEQRVGEDLSICLNTFVDCQMNITTQQSNFDMAGFTTLEQEVDFNNVSFDHYNESPDILVDDESAPTSFVVHSSLLRSNCRVTNQPDWADIFISMNGAVVPTNESMLQYIVSMRKENHFHEEICECVYTRLLEKFNPTSLIVCCLYTRRGGIDINPIRASHPDLIKNWFYDVTDLGNIVKTVRQ